MREGCIVETGVMRRDSVPCLYDASLGEVYHYSDLAQGFVLEAMVAVQSGRSGHRETGCKVWQWTATPLERPALGSIPMSHTTFPLDFIVVGCIY